ncbi:hypothetical protein JEK58_28165, partial [Klebsiella pneumoniae]|uniref:hypothetical protein n=1 Tax=Klebsiella pneumoniae TaxID=573 RepID=UPI0035BFC803|nr:hypothetical protein [Klebsiella pneumoniae]
KWALPGPMTMIDTLYDNHYKAADQQRANQSSRLLLIVWPPEAERQDANHLNNVLVWSQSRQQYIPLSNVILTLLMQTLVLLSLFSFVVKFGL